MKKKLLALVLSSVMLATALAGCGGSSAEPAAEAPAAESEAAPEAAEPAEETTQAEAPAGEGREIIYWSMWNSTENQAKVLQEAADAYEAETGIHVTIEWKGRDVKNIITTALEAGEKIDLYDDDYQRVVQNNGQFLEDLTDMVAAADLEKHILPVILNTAKEWGEGKLLVVPYQPYTTGVWYNKDILDGAGVTEAPVTWDEFKDVCQKIKDAGYAPLAMNSDEAKLVFGYQLARYIGQEKVVEVVEQSKWKATPEVLKAAEDIKSLFDAGYFSDNSPGEGKTSQEDIGLGLTAMMLGASWVPNEIDQTIGEPLNWGFFPWPTVEGGVDGVEAAMVGAQGFGINAKSENKQAAFDFAVKVATGEYDQKMAEISNSIPADVDNTEWPAVISGAQPYFSKMTKSYMWAIGMERNQDYAAVIQDNMIKLYTGGFNAEGFVDAMAKDTGEN